MKKRFKKVMAASLAGLMAVSLAACGGSQNSSTESGSAGGQTSASSADSGAVPSLEEALSPDQVVELDAWCTANESEPAHDAYVTAIEELEAEHPNIKINMEYFENETYKTKLKSAVAANEMPDIFFAWQGGFSQSFAESGKLLNLEPYYQAEYTELLPEEYTTNGRYVDGSLYTTSYAVSASVLMYNKAMFDQYGLKAPQTWEEFMEVCRELVDQGVKPLAVSVKDTWCLAALHDALALKSAGHDKTNSVLTRQGGSYDDEDFLYAAQQLQELVEMGAFIDGAAGLNYNEQLALFADGGAAMMVQLPAACQYAYEQAKNPEDFDVVAFPVVGDNAAITDMVGGCSDSFQVSAETKYPAIAAYAAFEISRKIASITQEEGLYISPWTDSKPAEKMSVITQKIQEILQDATSYVLWWDTTMVADDAAEYLSLLGQLYAGDLTAEEFVEGMATQLS